MVRSVLAVLVIAVFAVSASAYDWLYSGDTPMTRDAGSFGIGGGVWYLASDSWYDNDGEKTSAEDVEGLVDWGGSQTWIPVHVYYAAMDNLELGGNARFGTMDYEETWETRDEATTTYEGTGLGDTWVWAKYTFTPDPILTARVGVKFNTGTAPYGGYGAFQDEDGDVATGDGQMDIDGALMFGTEAGPGMFCGAVGYRYRMDRTVEVTTRNGEPYDLTPGNEIHFQASYTRYLGEAMSFAIAADGFFGSDPQADGEAMELPNGDTVKGMNGVWINPSFGYTMENGTELGVGFHYPLMGQNTQAVWGLNAFVGWGT
jgi:hypothetical protein